MADGDRIDKLAERISKDAEVVRRWVSIKQREGQQYTAVKPYEPGMPTWVFPAVQEAIRQGELPPLVPPQREQFEPFLKPFEVFHEKVARPFGAGVLRPFYESPWQAATGFLKHPLFAPPESKEMERYRGWEDPMLRFPFGVNIGLKGVTETAPYMFLPGPKGKVPAGVAKPVIGAARKGAVQVGERVVPKVGEFARAEAGFAKIPKAKPPTGSDVIEGLARNIQLNDANARLANQFIAENVRPAFMKRFGDAPVMSIQRQFPEGGEAFLRISTGGWRSRAEQMGLEFVEQRGFDDLYRIPGAKPLALKPPIKPPMKPPVEPPVGGELFADLQPFDEMAQIAFKPDMLRKVGNLPVMREFMASFPFGNPAAVANTPPLQAVVGRAMQRFQGQQQAQGIMAHLSQLGTQEQVFGKLAADGTLGTGPLKGIHLNEIRTFPKKYISKLTPQQQEWVEGAALIERQKLDFLKRNGIEIRELTFDEGGEYAGRRVMGKLSPEGELLDVAYVGAGPGRPGAKLAAEKVRVYKNIEDAVADGFVYLPEDEALRLNVMGAYNRVADKQMSDWLLTRVPWRTTGAPEEIKMIAFAAKRKADHATQLVAALNRAVRGERIPDSTINSIASAFPEEAARLKNLIPQLQRRNPMTAKEVQSLTARAKELLQETKADAAKAVSVRARAREAAMIPKFGEGAVRAPAFQGKILTGPDAQETARIMNKAFEPEYSRLLGAVNKVDAVIRSFLLAGDMSPFQIQLIFMPGAFPKAFGKSFVAFPRAMLDTRFVQRYLAEPVNAQVVRGSRDMIIPLQGATEVTEAFATGGLLTKFPLKYPAALLKPFQRGYEAGMTVAGVEMKKSLQHLATTPERAAAVDQFINKFRGLGSRARLGVSPVVRQGERAMLLTPQYNVSIASILFDVGRGTLSGQLARKALAKGVLAVAGAFAAISYAMGETPEEIAEHFNWGSSKFLTWDIVGQNIGPGSKVRSVLKLIGQSVKNPDDLWNLSMKNPAFRFGRGLSAPSVSTGYDLFSGRDFIGDRTRDGLLSLTDTVIAQNFLPIWLQTFLLEGGDLAGRATRGAAEFGGWRSFPQPASQQRRELRDKLAKEKYPNLGGWYKMPRGLQNELRRTSEELQDLDKQVLEEKLKRGDSAETVDDWARATIRQLKYDERERLAGEVLAGKMDLGEYGQLTYKLSLETSGMYDLLELIQQYLDPSGQKDYEKWKEDHIHPLDKALDEYYDIERDEAKEKWLAKQPPAIKQYIDYMTNYDWKKNLGPDAQKVQAMKDAQGGGGLGGATRQGIPAGTLGR